MPAKDDLDLMRRAYRLLYTMLEEAAPYLAKTDFGELNEVMVALDRRTHQEPTPVGPRCRSCGAEVMWAITERGKRIPLDKTPTPAGNIHLYDGVAYVLEMRGQPIIEHRAHGDPLYVAHFATCPNADQHRKRKP